MGIGRLGIVVQFRQYLDLRLDVSFVLMQCLHFVSILFVLLVCE